MRPPPALAAALFAIWLLFAVVCQTRSAGQEAEPGMGEAGPLISLAIETGRQEGDLVSISGRDASQQLVVTGHFECGQLRDLTRQVEYTVSPEDVVQVDGTGHVTPLREGKASIHVQHASGPDAIVRVQVTHIEQDLPINFPNQIVPVFTKYGCNSGGCHGKSEGQNGFALSLLGFEPDKDYEYLVKEARGRRVFPAAPERSLLLAKAAGDLPHGGGQRIEHDSPAYRLLHRWVAQGMPYGQEDDPLVTHIQLLPDQRLIEPNGVQQLVVVAHYNDGTSQDVTRMSQFESNDPEMAEVGETGLVTTSQLTGSVAVMARFQSHVDVFRATIPLGIDVEGLPRPKNYIDELVFRQLRELGMPASQPAGDSTFLRRVTLDITGRLPTLEEAEAFLADSDPNKRAAAIDRLLDSTDYAEYFANKWSAILRNQRRQDQERTATFAFHSWIRQNFHQNKPYDLFVRDIVTATGEPGVNPPSAWYRQVRDQESQVEDAAQLFLGLRLQCARCHHHPSEKMSQDDYYGLAAFFSRVGRKRSPVQGIERIYHNRGTAQAQNPNTNENLLPTGLGDDPMQIDPLHDPRHKLVDWMADPDNPYFAKALVNRYWRHFFGRGLVDPEDDLRATNPASNPLLLDALAQDFIDSGFDLKHLIRTICNSTVYQLSAEPNQWNQDDRQNFSRFYPRRLPAEVLLDAIDQVTGSSTHFGGLPPGTRAVSLPDSGFDSYFLTVFGRPESSSACECERSDEANLAQSLHLLNSSEVQAKLTGDDGRAARLAGDQQQDHASKLRQLYLLAFSREPTEEEASITLAHLEAHQNPRLAYEDLLWALINTKEFLFNH